jgi:hypothetical protein
MQELVSNKHHLFGVSLFDLTSGQTSDGENDGSGVPAILVKAFKTIEERAYKDQEDLYDV